MNDIIKQATEYAFERVKKGFEFEVERATWVAVIEVAPRAVAATLGISSIGGHVVVVAGCVAVLSCVVVCRRRGSRPPVQEEVNEYR
ncbi:hypothetical protein AB4Y32_25315 [Paraburkholderia phymatum]|uniref:Uncharacterized protein n=1 Tax=Paraburkholderia phymatum TaxID=148447 RepID=A0ACC6U5W9_9BURK